MDKRILQTYATWAKETLENQIEVSLKALGVNDENNIKQANKVGDVTTIEGDPTSYPADLFGKRENIITLIKSQGYKNVIEEFAYTWFNRFVALRFMEVHGFLSHGFRVLSDPAGGIEPEILKNLNLVKDELHLDMELCNEYKQQGKIEELFRHVLFRQCSTLAGILPMLFSADLDYLELLLPNNLLKGETVITRLNEIPESAFLEEIEIIGWMYQFYISAKKDAVNKSKKTITKDTLPAVTQLFTPDWIVRYMAQNSVGRLWLESYPDSLLRTEMTYYVEDAEQTEEVQKKIDEIKYKNVNPEEIRIIEPCCGSGHILVYVFDLLYNMYDERGYQKRDIPTLILKNNLVGLDVDKRASQLASFSLIMKARSLNNRFFNDQYYTTPHVYEFKDSKILEELNYRNHLKELNLLNDEEIKMITYLVDTFKNAKTIGSLLKVKRIDFEGLNNALDRIKKKAVSDMFNLDFMSIGIKRLEVLSNLANILSSKYDVMITNPPYIEISKMEGMVKDYAIKEYPASKTDMFAMFMETDFVKKNGFMSMINMHSWMFLSTYEKMRNHLYISRDIVSMVHLGKRAFETITGEVVQTTAFVIRNANLRCKAVYFRDVDIGDKEKKFFETRDNKNYYVCSYDDFMSIPGTPLSYWASDSVREAFSTETLYGQTVSPSQNITGNNTKYVRKHWELKKSQIGGKDDWIFYAKGGGYRKWWGNLEDVVNWSPQARYIYQHGDGKHASQIINKDYWYRKGITWGLITSYAPSFRIMPDGATFDKGGSTVIVNEDLFNYALGLLNSKIYVIISELLNPTLNNQVKDIRSMPVKRVRMSEINSLVDQAIKISKNDWDNYENSWEFTNNPLNRGEGKLSDIYKQWEKECLTAFEMLREIEEKLNDIFFDIYGLTGEYDIRVEEEAISIRKADKESDIRALVSYLVGVAMGRYSLDVPGLAYAGDDWDASKYISYQPDDDGIIPIYNGIGMEDGLTTVLIKLIKQIYGENTYRENIDFIADALGKKNNESSEETLNRYLNDKNGFYKNHLTIYQKKPIYWLFSSGDNSGFKCLVYMHRYNEDTLARINAKYFLPESTRKKNELDELNSRIAHAEGREKLRFEKERQNLAAAYNEAIEYGQVLDHMANQYISIDLDDGVKVNYAKFQGVEIVTDGGSKVKKDLLYPL